MSVFREKQALTSVACEDDGVEVVARATECLLGEEEQRAEGQLRQAHGVHDRVRVGLGGGQVSKVHRAVVAWAVTWHRGGMVKEMNNTAYN
jgi:hypothetical protein